MESQGPLCLPLPKKAPKIPRESPHLPSLIPLYLSKTRHVCPQDPPTHFLYIQGWPLHLTTFRLFHLQVPERLCHPPCPQISPGRPTLVGSRSNQSPLRPLPQAASLSRP